MPPIPPGHRLLRARRLRQPRFAEAALDALGDSLEAPEVDALLALVGEPGSPARAASLAVERLAEVGHDAVSETLIAALRADKALVRIAAVRALDARGAEGRAPAIEERLGQDPTWICRRSAVEALAAVDGEAWWGVLRAADDPHWRVRHALAEVLLSWVEQGRVEPEHALARVEGADLRQPEGRARVEGLAAYLRWRLSGRQRRPEAPDAPPDLLHALPEFDPDPKVTHRELAALDKEARRERLSHAARMLGAELESTRTLGLGLLRRWGGPSELARALRWRDDPRYGVGETLERLLGYLNYDRREALSRYVLSTDGPSAGPMAWALDQIGAVYPPELEAESAAALLAQLDHLRAPVRLALAHLVGRTSIIGDAEALDALRTDVDPLVRAAAIAATLDRGLDLPDREAHAADPSSDVREVVARRTLGSLDEGTRRALAADPALAVRQAVAASLDDAGGDLRELLMADRHPMVRAAALDARRAQELVDDPTQETSWLVLERAAILAKAPIWTLLPDEEPDPPRPSVATVHVRAPDAAPQPPDRRLLGPKRLPVAPLSISGHYGLPEEGYARALEAGVNLLFWEPNYTSLTRFCEGLPPARRADLNLLAGTFEADAAGARRDVERALRHMKLERLAVFLVFWVRSHDRINDALRAELERMQRDGMIDTFGLSTHDRGLAVDAIEAGWDPVMVRHNLAHRGAEARIFPAAQARGTSLITFNATCYGRLMKPHGASVLPSAADCYRYSLSFDAVTTCFSAPATLEELDHNLQILKEPDLNEARREALMTHGDMVYAENSVFARTMRWI